MTERKIILAKLTSTHVLVLPSLLMISIILVNYKFLLLGIDQTFLLILCFAGYWEFFGLKFKRMFLGLCQISIILLFSYGVLKAEALNPNLLWLSFFGLIELYLINLLVRILLTIFNPDEENVEISFPFRQGDYLITDGGNSKISRMMNYHFHSRIHKQKKTNSSMLYATDIVKITKGNREFMPSSNENYPVFGDTIYCPLEGTIVKVINDINDNLPYSGNYPYNTGNSVVIRNGQYYFLLGHLKKGTISVKVGDKLNRNDRLGEAGNSGMSERPHLHMQLMKSNDDNYWRGMGINIKYQGKNLFKNRLIRIKSAASNI